MNCPNPFSKQSDELVENHPLTKEELRRAVHTNRVQHDAPADFERKGSVIHRCPACELRDAIIVRIDHDE